MLREIQNLFKRNIPFKFIKLSVKNINVRRSIVVLYNLEPLYGKESDSCLILSGSFQYFRLLTIENGKGNTKLI